MISTKPLKKENKFLPKDYIPKRFGLKYDPPTIILEYMLQHSGKLYHHKMKLLKLKENNSESELLDYLYKRHSIYLTHESITESQIMDLIAKLKNGPKIQPKKTKLDSLAPINNKNSKIETKDSFWNNFEEDYNKLDQETLNKKKKEMDKMFVKNQKKPDDNDFVYDVQEDFFPNKENEWDMDDEMDIIS